MTQAQEKKKQSEQTACGVHTQSVTVYVPTSQSGQIPYYIEHSAASLGGHLLSSGATLDLQQNTILDSH